MRKKSKKILSNSNWSHFIPRLLSIHVTKNAWSQQPEDDSLPLSSPWPSRPTRPITSRQGPTNFPTILRTKSHSFFKPYLNTPTPFFLNLESIQDIVKNLTTRQIELQWNIPVGDNDANQLRFQYFSHVIRTRHKDELLIFWQTIGKKQRRRLVSILHIQEVVTLTEMIKIKIYLNSSNS